MPIPILGNSGVVAEVGGTVHRALRGETRPLDHGSLGQYRMGPNSGLVAAHAAAGELWQFRWSDATRFAVPLYLKAKLVVTTGPTVAQEAGIELIRATAWSADGTGGTALASTAAGGFKVRATMPNSLVGATGARIATTAALGVGTKTLDAVGMSSTSDRELAVAATVGSPNREMDIEFAGDAGVSHPLVLAQNEGLVIRSTIATVVMVVKLHVTFAWAEVASY